MDSRGQSAFAAGDWRVAIEEFHRAPVACVISATGGGSSAICRLLELPGASRTVLEAIVPYAPLALDSWLRRPPEQYCSRETALAMAAAAFERAEALSSRSRPVHEGSSGLAERGPMLIGAGCTASLVSERPKRGDHRLHVAAHSCGATAWRSVTLQKGLRDRRGEEQLAGDALLGLLLGEAGIATVPGALLEAGEVSTAGRQAADAGLRRLMERRADVVWRAPDGLLVEGNAAWLAKPLALLSGSFNPRHEGHKRLREAAARRLACEVAYEISIRNVDKPPLDFVTLYERAAQFGDTPLAVTSAPTFVEKSRIFRGAAFVVGFDTALRILEPRYYGNDPAQMDAAVTEIAANGCTFLVAGRKRGEQFETLSELSIPGKFAGLFQALSESEFRVDCSSTEIRRRLAELESSSGER